MLLFCFVFDMKCDVDFGIQMNEKFRKSDLALTMSIDQYDVKRWLDEDTARVNLILYSNVVCLSNNQSTVELQFSK